MKIISILKSIRSLSRSTALRKIGNLLICVLLALHQNKTKNIIMIKLRQVLLYNLVLKMLDNFPTERKEERVFPTQTFHLWQLSQDFEIL